MANAPLSSPRPRVSRAAASRAVDSLLKWIRSQRNPKIFSPTHHEEYIFLILTLTQTPHKLQSKAYRIPLPHSLHHPSTISLLLHDRPNSLLTDSRRIATLLRSFEKKERGKRSMPAELDFAGKVWPEQVRQVCCSTVLNLGSGNCSGIRVGRASQGRDEIVDNLMAAVDGAVMNVPRKWSNVMGFHLKMSESLALPIYEKSNWSHNKVGDDENERSEEEERMERRPEGGSRKRASNRSELNGGEVRKTKKKILRYGVG